MDRKVREIKAWLWFYKENEKNYPGTHFTAKKTACEAIKADLAAMADIGRRKVVYALPELEEKDIHKISGTQLYRCFRQLTLVRTESDTPIRLIQDQINRAVEIQISPDGEAEFLEILDEVVAGKGDTSLSVLARRTIDPEFSESSLWYWPCFGHLLAVQEPGED